MNIYFEKGKVLVREAAPEDAEILAGCLREANRLEILAGSGKEPPEVLRMSYLISALALTALYDGRVVAMGGVVPLPEAGKNIVWMLGAPDFAASKLAFCRVTKTIIKLFLEQYPVLENWFDARHVDTIKWLEWLGAEVEPARPFGVAGLPFHRFIFTDRGRDG